jgi:hypothetical protein
MVDPPIKYFSLDEANRTLPYVRRVVTDIVEEYQAWRDSIRRYELIAAASRSDVGETNEQVALRQEVDTIARRINGFIQELARVGCVFKGFEPGLVDFYSQLNGRDIFLCWQLGEGEIGYWHELDTGFAGRRALAPEFAHGRPAP